MNKLTKIIAASAVCSAFIIPSALAAEPADEINYQNHFNVATAQIAEVDLSDESSSWVVRNEKDELLFITDSNRETKYVDGYLNLRSVPSTDSEPIDVLCPNDAITRVGVDDCGWALVEIDEEIYFVWNEYLMDEPAPEPEPVKQESKSSNAAAAYEDSTSAEYSASYFRKMGVIYWGAYRWTYYSEKVLPGGGLNIPGRHVNSSGYVCDGDGYICLASNDLSKGTVVSTPFGSAGKVYDCGCASGTLDVYVSW